MNIFDAIAIANVNVILLGQNINHLNDGLQAVINATPHYMKACAESKKALEIIDRANARVVS
jgi:hypothetical protein